MGPIRICDLAGNALARMIGYPGAPIAGSAKECDPALAALREWWTSHRESLDWKALKEAAAERALKD